ncbi:MAG: hypothetical protein A2097_00685 [Desulfobacula sp. GWF2_41_7]|nr:MAG: hypothetical protein A2097_00685 [Desulfobacula sp. GWF2_41_7]
MNKKKEKIAIVGAGAIGSLVGGILSHVGEDITLIGNKAHVDAIGKNGLHIDGKLGKFKVMVKAEESLDFNPDLVFISVKNQDVETACRKIKPFVHGVPIVLMQNGVRSIEIAGRILGKNNLIGCILLLNAKFLKPGAVSYVNQKPILIGSTINGKNDDLSFIQALLNHISETTISNNIIGAQWSKLLVNSLGNSLDGMTGLNLGQYALHSGLRKIGILILKEALMTIKKAGIKLEPLPGMPLFTFTSLIRLPTRLAAWLLKFVLLNKGDPNIITSTLQSLQKRKKTEIDFLNGEFVALGKTMGIPTPVNEKVLYLIHEIEQTHKFFSADTLTKKFDTKIWSG